MRKVLILSAIALMLVGCGNFQKNLLFEVGKDITIEAVAELLRLDVAEFEKDSIRVAGDFFRSDFRRVLGNKISDKLTPNGEFYFKNQKVQTSLRWAVKPDSVMVYVEFNRFKK
ncbi:MAG: hypothetical protein VKL39_24185 [Leptolyngbyaceae bacterium]|nr:hypothetical protein [Leptolyngbyaceae bacterium]